MEQERHGGDWAGFVAEYGRPPLDFSASVSPLGTPPGVAEALRQAIPQADRYPDPLCRALRERISEAAGLPASQILCGNGAAELIYRAVLARRPRRALVTAPGFSEYEAALAFVSCQVERYALQEERDFRPDEGLIHAVTPGMDMVFLCQPNNPTGVTAPRELVERLLARCREVGALLVLDECFCDFLDDPAQSSLVDRVTASPNLLILKAFTKLYAMAGLRLGYALCADVHFLADMSRAGPPWSVSSLAQAAGLAALEEGNYVKRLRTLVAEERPRLGLGLAALGLRAIPGEANFLLFQCRVPLLEPLGRRGILLRRCETFAGLDESWYRTAVRTNADNGRLLAALGEILQENQRERRDLT